MLPAPCCERHKQRSGHVEHVSEWILPGKDQVDDWEDEDEVDDHDSESSQTVDHK